MVGFFHFAHTRIPCNLNPILWATQSSYWLAHPLFLEAKQEKKKYKW